MKFSKSIAIASFALLPFVASSVAVRPAFALGKTMMGHGQGEMSEMKTGIGKTMMGHMSASEKRTFMHMSPAEKALMMKMMHGKM